MSLSGAGSLSGTPTASGSFSFSVQAADTTGNSAVQGLALGINPALAITTSSIPAAVQGVAYSQSLSATGGAGNYSWSVSGGALPAGISLGGGGTLSGTPTVSGPFSFTAKVSDGVSSSTQTLSLNVGATLSITSSGTLPNGFAGTPYSVGLTATGGTGDPIHGRYHRALFRPALRFRRPVPWLATPVRLTPLASEYR